MKSFNFIIALVWAVLSAVACGIQLWGSYGVWALVCYATFIVAFPVCIILHELGHVVFGAIVKIKAVPQFSLIGSSCCKIIPRTDKKLRGKLFFTTMGGVFINFIIFVLGVVSLFVNAIPTWLCVFMPASAYLFVLNALPETLPNGKTDGLVMYELMKNDDTAKVMTAVLTVQAQVLNGKPITEVDERLLFDVPVIQEDDPCFISLTQLRYEYFKCKGDVEKAQKYKARFDELKEYLK